MRVFCNLQFVKLGWEKWEREIRWKKTRVTLSRQKQSAGGVNVVACKRMVIMDSFMSDVKKKAEQNWRVAPVIEHARSKV